MFEFAKRLLRSLPYPVKRAIYFGTLRSRKIWFYGRARYCPVCQSRVRKFYPIGYRIRPNAWCPVCGARERQRLVWLYLQQRFFASDKPTGRILHVAPDPMFTFLFDRMGLNHVTADLMKKHVQVNLDISAIPIGENAFDLVYCSHVLEHVPDDLSAMDEFFRVLKPGGTALVQVPMDGNVTFEDAAIVTEEERLERFGHREHVRIYGVDIEERLVRAGFETEQVVGSDVAPRDALMRLGIPEEEVLFVCRKSDSPGLPGGIQVND